jgi:hypothetical protein
LAPGLPLHLVVTGVQLLVHQLVLMRQVGERINWKRRFRAQEINWKRGFQTEKIYSN